MSLQEEVSVRLIDRPGRHTSTAGTVTVTITHIPDVRQEFDLILGHSKCGPLSTYLSYCDLHTTHTNYRDMPGNNLDFNCAVVTGGGGGQSSQTLHPL